ncbi:MAG: hypothetical protein ACUVQG_10385 [Thermogutta sp.]
MASDVTYTPLPPPPPVVRQQDVDPEEVIILRQVETTRRRIATVELTWRILVLLAGMLVFAIISAAFDQWIFPTGMPNLARWLLWAGFITTSLIWMVVAVAPYLMRRIHPIFAAYVVEQAVPNLKHSLISFLSLRDSRDQFQADPIRKSVFRGLETTTANTVAKVPVDTVVDRSQIIRTGYILVVLIALFCLYIIFSPKDPFRSFARTLFPWSRLAPPTRVRINDVRPGTTGIVEGEPVIISANVRGLRAGEEVKVVYSTSDRQAVNQIIPMTQKDDNTDQFSCELSQSFRQETVYRILAGDAATEEFKLHVVIPVRFRIRTIEYQFPPYTGLPPRVTNDLGDIRAVEGTEIKLTADSDVALSSAEMVIERAQSASIPMVLKAREAFARMILRLSKPNGHDREFAAYFIRGQSVDGRPSVDPVKYTIEIIPDQPPQGTWLEPAQEEVSLPVDGTLPLRIQAEDPDFGLRQVGLEIEVGGSSRLKHAFLEKPAGQSHSGKFVGEFEFVPKDFNLAAGDVAICRVTLVDNREPTPNRSVLRLRRIRITEESGTAASRNPQPPAAQQQAQNPPSSEGASSQEETQNPPKAGLQPKDESEQSSPPDRQERQPERRDAANDTASKTPEQRPAQQQQEPQGDQGKQPESSSATENGNSEDRTQKNGGAENQNQQTGDSATGQSKPEQSPDSDSSRSADAQAGTQSQPQGSQSADRPAQAQDTQSRRGDDRPAGDRSESTTSEQADQKGSKGSQQATGGEPSIEPDNQPNQGNAQKSGSQQENGAPQSGNQQPQDVKSGQSSGGQNAMKPEESAQANASKGDPQSQAESPDGRQQGSARGGQEGRTSDSATDGQQQPNQAVGGSAQSSASNQTGNDSSSSSSAAGNFAGSGSDKGSDSTSQGAKSAPPDGQQKGGSASEKIDGVTNPGEAVERILSYLERKGIDPSQIIPGAKGSENDSPRTQQAEKGLGEGEKSATGSADRQRGDSNSGEVPTTPQAEVRPGASSEIPARPQSAGRSDHPKQRQPEEAVPMGATPSEGESPGREFNHQLSGEPPAAAQPQSSSQTPRRPPEGVAGDQAGMGGRGGGQDSQQPGEGTSGSQTPTDSQEGMPVASQGGQETGTSSGQSGPAGESTTSQGASQPSGWGEMRSQPGGELGKRDTPKGGELSSTQGGNVGRGGMPGGFRGPGTGPEPVDTPVDDPNLVFARRQTDLVLRYLEDELAKQKPDTELLDQLGWSPQDAAEFVRRWKELKQAAEEPSPQGKAAQRQLNEILKSLGIKPRTSSIQGGQQHQDELRGMDAGRDIPPPPQWSEYFQAYLKSLGASPWPSW